MHYPGRLAAIGAVIFFVGLAVWAFSPHPRQSRRRTLAAAMSLAGLSTILYAVAHF